MGLAAALVLAALNGSGGSSRISKAQYDQWRSECELRATETLDTSLYTVGGNHWADAVNSCMTTKANDQLPRTSP